MRISLLNETDWAGTPDRLVLLLAETLRGLGHEVTTSVRLQRGRREGVRQLDFPSDVGSRMRRTVKRWRIRHAFAGYRKQGLAVFEPFDGDRSQYGSDLAKALPACDVLNLHFVAGMLDYGEFLAEVTQRLPVVWTLHDMNVWTGGCHYDEFCGRAQTGCGRCKQLGSDDPDDLSAQVWQRKRSALERVTPGRLHFVAPSQWVAAEVRGSPLLSRFPLSVIPYGVDLSVFKPRNSRWAREVLQLPANARIILFVAQGIFNPRKGFSYLVEALRRLQAMRDLCLVSVGSLPPSIDFAIPHHHLGVVTREGILALAYNAADVFVAPSLQDNLPCSIMESLACGTPVVAFDVGGIPDLVRPGVTGTLAPAGSVEALTQAIREMIERDAARSAMAQQCRRVAETEYAPELQGRRYEALFRSLM